MYRLAIVTSHPIQYQAPFFGEISKKSDVDLTVYFRKKIGIEKPFHDKGFGLNLKWDIPLLEGYKYEFVGNWLYFIRKLNKKKPDAIILYGWNHFFNIFLLLFVSKIISIPVFLYGENPLSHEFRKRKILIFMKKIWLSFLFSKTKLFLYIGKENKKFYKFYGVPENKLFFMPYAVDNRRFIKEYKLLNGERNSFRSNLKISEKELVIMFAGKLIEKKRPLDLLEVFELLSFKNSALSFSLVFVGDGELKPKLEDYVEKKNIKNVHFVGFQNQAKISSYYAIADIFVLPSGISETWGLVVNEAMCFELPVIISDMVGCGSDLVHNGENGFIFPVGNKKALVLSLESLLTDSEKRKKFGQKSAEIIKKYSFEEDIQGVLKALKNL